VNDLSVNAIRALEQDAGTSPFESARAKRGLTREEAAARSALGVDEITWLEEGRLYRFRSAHQAVAVAATYSAALGIDHHEALELAGRPLPPLAKDTRRYRIMVGGGIAALLLLLVGALAIGSKVTGGTGPGGVAAAKLPPTESITVDVYNGAGDMTFTKSVADRVTALGYGLRHVNRVRGPFSYRETSVYYPPHAQAIAARLAKSLCVDTKPLPSGTSRRRLVVIAGPATVGGC
jgi:Helix-turn-helix domain/LytR cell envelope-related transcriptional attenuator